MRLSGQGSYRITDILTEMAVVAWHPVCLYRLSLGRQDMLQKAILQCQDDCQFRPDADAPSVRRYIESTPSIWASLQPFSQYVPARFLVPWFSDKLRGIPDHRKDKLIRDLARENQGTPLPCPYWFDGEHIRPNESWQAFLPF